MAIMIVVFDVGAVGAWWFDDAEASRNLIAVIGLYELTCLRNRQLHFTTLRFAGCLACTLTASSKVIWGHTGVGKTGAARCGRSRRRGL